MPANSLGVGGIGVLASGVALIEALGAAEPLALALGSVPVALSLGAPLGGIVGTLLGIPELDALVGIDDCVIDGLAEADALTIGALDIAGGALEVAGAMVWDITTLCIGALVLTDGRGESASELGSLQL